MKDNRYDFKDVEQLLGPRCDFHASEDLKEKITDRARRMAKPRRAHLMPWIAAACAAGILVIFLTPPKNGDTATARKAPVTDTVSAQPPRQPAPTADIRKENNLTATASPAVKKKPAPKRSETRTPHTSSDSRQAEAPAKAARRNITGPMPAAISMDGASPDRIISEADLPITNRENFEYTAEEIEQIRRLSAKACLARMRLEVEIAKYNMEQMANI
ncbi:MAG TPA: hypothetical protein DEB74_20205 [Lachnospiraceae bacterium]|jgi:hypothetical protein|nr:hypothetical protein [Lachnospiraceae bacterium]